MTTPPGLGAVTLTIRHAGPTDLAPIERLLKGAKLPVAGVADALDAFLVVDAGGRVVGAAGLEVHGEDGVLRSVVVDPALQHRGVGAELTARVVGAARRAGLRRLYLLTMTAEAFFTRRGFRRTARESAPAAVRASVEFREACPDTAVAMVLTLERRDALRPDQ